VLRWDELMGFIPAVPSAIVHGYGALFELPSTARLPATLANVRYGLFLLLAAFLLPGIAGIGAAISASRRTVTAPRSASPSSCCCCGSSATTSI
jgi:hypothetical protein